MKQFLYMAFVEKLRIPTRSNIVPRIVFLVMLSVIPLLISCGLLRPGRTGINDPVPQGTIVAQGSFIGLNGNTASGTAAVYLTSGAQYVVRLEALQAPSQNGHIIEVVADGSVVYSSALTGISGNQNYPVGSVTVSNWNYVSILSSTTPQPLNQVARANLIRITTNP